MNETPTSRLLKLLALLTVAIYSVEYINANFQDGLTMVRDGNTSMSLYNSAASWLVAHLGPSDCAVVPFVSVLLDLQPHLRGKLVDYSMVWSAAGVVLKSDTTPVETQKVVQKLINIIGSDNSVKFLVRDWVYPYGTAIFKQGTNDDLSAVTSQVTEFNSTLTTHYRVSIQIYGRASDSSSPSSGPVTSQSLCEG